MVDPSSRKGRALEYGEALGADTDDLDTERGAGSPEDQQGLKDDGDEEEEEELDIGGGDIGLTPIRNSGRYHAHPSNNKYFASAGGNF